MIKYKLIDHPADIAVEVYGSSLESLYENAAEAWLESVTDNHKVLPAEKKTLLLSGSSYEELLVNFLNEINYQLFSKKWISSRFDKIKIEKDNDTFLLSVQIKGEKFSRTKHQLKDEIKAVTFHQIDIKKKGRQYKTILIFDI